MSNETIEAAAKPRLPIDVKSGDLCDRKGVPIHVGDLIQTDHFRDCRRKMHYLYHVVTARDGVLRMTPVSQVATGKCDGGECHLLSVADDDGVLRSSLVLDGSPLPDDRKRRKVAASAPAAGEGESNG